MIVTAWVTEQACERTTQHEIITGTVCFHALLELEVVITLITIPPHRLTLALEN